MTEVIKVKYLRDIYPIEPIANGDWIDLRCGENIFMDKKSQN